ncbi:MAG: signal peptidase I [Clostridia bacterium]|nr:signal peptidase I [Clostridia bacterium]
MKIEKEKMKMLIKILLNCIYIIITICVLYNIIFLINTTISEKDYFKLFGISLFNMQTNLMENDISKNDLVIVKEVQEQDLQKGDIIAYNVNGKIRINKIINEKQGYITKSNGNYQPDIENIDFNNIIGKKIINIPILGGIIGMLQSKITSMIILITLIFVYFYNKNLYTKKKERVRKKKKYCM